MKYRFIIFFLIPLFAFAQNKYKISFKIEGLKDTSVFLGYHYGNKKYVVDTARVNSKGEGAFEGNKVLTGGVYLVILPSKQYFEMLIDKEQEFSFSTDTVNFISNLKYKNSPENKVFNEYQKFMVEKQSQMAGLGVKFRITADPKEKENINKEMDAVDQEIEDNLWAIAKDNPNTLLSAILKAMADPVIPQEILAKNDSVLRKKYYKDHYFDDFDITDPRLLKSPVFYSKIDQFFSKVVFQNPDSIIKELVKVLDKAKSNNETHRYILVYLLSHFDELQIMRMEEVFIYVAENYFLKYPDEWKDAAFLARLRSKVDILRPTLVGAVAPEIQMPSTDGQSISLSKITADFTILFFWDPQCSHCVESISKMKEIYNKYHPLGIELLAVYIESDATAWKKFIKDNELENWMNVYDPYNISNFRDLYDLGVTPSILLLDKYKRIIAKKIDADTLEMFLKKIYGQ